jgi:hypothetical protein
MESNKQQSGSSTSRGKVWASIVTTALGVVASLISSIVATADILKVSKEWGLAIAAALITVAISAGFTSMIARRERGTSRIAKLKDDLSGAYLGALDASSLNPLRGGSR